MRKTFRLGLAAIGMAVGLSAAASAQELTLYTAGPADLADRLAKGFEASTGTKVNVFQATTGKVMARLEAERANPQADVVISAAWQSALELKERGDLLEYVSPNAQTVPDSLKDSHYVAQGAAALAIVWNSKSGKPRPSDWSDLAAPDYKDAVTMPDPAASGAAYGLVSALVTTQADAAWKTFGGLKDNGMVIAGANAQALNPVLQGAKAAVMGAVDYIALAAKEKGESIDVIYPASGTVLEARPAMILKSTRSPDLAKQFIDYMLSEEGQAMVADTYMLPARADVAAKRPGWSELTVLEVDHNEAPAKRQELLTRFKTAVGAQ
ncbi:ABC transporter substrate-binding protein [Telmatospirillum sp. J64-1]|uniref:ABC transporter substrate-binding protein n=1 Tax=Telmatospirillum sp. J64-1 TaxID=2502183 RepID=UPI00115D903C|nr:ABC transporter substrate-binding protein [Telmatospirillum sp. J64-1]